MISSVLFESSTMSAAFNSAAPMQKGATSQLMKGTGDTISKGRVMRDGSCLDDKHACSAQRREGEPDYRWKDIGFRLVAVPRS
jgi:formylglycine-generating enzyme required for sulfatase activity